MRPYQDTVVEGMASQNIGLKVAIGPRRLTANAIPERQRLISMSARGRLPTSNTFELIKNGKLVKEEEEKQQQKVKVRWTVPTLLLGLRWPTDATILRPCIIVKSNKSVFDLEI